MAASVIWGLMSRAGDQVVIAELRPEANPKRTAEGPTIINWSRPRASNRVLRTDGLDQAGWCLRGESGGSHHRWRRGVAEDEHNLHSLRVNVVNDYVAKDPAD